MYVVTNKGESVRAFGDAAGLLVLPGVNRIDDPIWDRLVKNPAVKEMVESGELEAKRVDAADGLASLGSMKPPAAIQLVKETLDRALLLLWRKAEGRAVVQSAIDKQLAAVSLTDEERKAPTEAKG